MYLNLFSFIEHDPNNPYGINYEKVNYDDVHGDWNNKFGGNMGRNDQANANQSNFNHGYQEQYQYPNSAQWQGQDSNQQAAQNQSQYGSNQQQYNQNQNQFGSNYGQFGNNQFGSGNDFYGNSKWTHISLLLILIIV